MDELVGAHLPADVVVIGEIPGAVGSRTQGRSAERPARAPYRSYLAGAGIVAAVTVLATPLRNILDPANLVMLYLAGVVLAALRWGRGPAVTAAGLSVLAFDVFFVPPRFSIVVHDTQYLLTFLGLFLVGIVVSTLVARARDRLEAARAREQQTATLFGLSRELAVAGDEEAIAAAVQRNVAASLRCDNVLFVARDEELLPIGHAMPAPLTPEETAVASWVARNGRPAGRGTDTIAAVDVLFLPLRAAAGVVGVLGVRLAPDSAPVLPVRTRQLLEAFASQAALALERVNFAGRAQQAKVLEEADRLHQAILNSLSHDLRTPLATITGALSSLARDDVPMPAATRDELLAAARGEADRLNLFVSNLLDMSRLEAGALALRTEWYDVDDLVGSALASLGGRARERSIDVHVPAGLPMIRADFVLLTQALSNILDNALRYAPAGTPVTVSAACAGEDIEIFVEDEGPGIPDGDLEQVFEKFYRVQRGDRTSGTGLGLAICRGIVEVHGGRVQAQRGARGGARLVMRLPGGIPPSTPGVEPDCGGREGS